MQKEIQNSASVGEGAKVLAGACYLAAVAGLIAFVGRLAALGLGLADLPNVPAGAWAWGVDLGLLAALAVQHSGMARAGFKRLWMRVVPSDMERSTYVGMSGVVLLALSLLWQPLGGEEVWQLPMVFAAVALLGGLGLTLVAGGFDHLGILGIRPVWAMEQVVGDQLRIIGPYRWVRHPLMSCAIILLWGWPVMSPTLALLSGGLTLYIFLSLPLEEATLIGRFGDAYRTYRRRVPAYVPWRRPVPASTHDEVAP
jgi:protein-S-isoprenylcysteine O-methyltransferase Ste14